MASTYQPLLQWYTELLSSGSIHVELLKNLGHIALWDCGVLAHYKEFEYIVYTDSDIDLNENTLPGFIEKLIMIAKDYRADKVGLAIEYRDLSDTPFCNTIRSIEERYWNNRLPHPTMEIYNAPIDTTFAVLRKGSPYHIGGLRVAGQGFTCRHLPWYNEYNNLTEEEQFVFDNADSRFSSYKALLQR